MNVEEDRSNMLLSNRMENIVIEKPRQLTIVSAVPLMWTLQFVATSVENNGESAITVAPQNSMKIRKKA
jgi:hypothetical protein